AALYAGLTAKDLDAARSAAGACTRAFQKIDVLHAWAYACATILLLHVGQDRLALTYALSTEPHWHTRAPMATMIPVVFSVCLLAQRLPGEVAAAQAEIALLRARLSTWAAVTPQNFLHMKLLVDACEAWKEGRDAMAQALFHDAIVDAHENGFVSDEALSLRL